MELGALITLEDDLAEKMKTLTQMGLYTCQLCSYDVEGYTKEGADFVRRTAQEWGVKITAFWCGGALEGPCVWNFYEGPVTIGLVPTAYRAKRLENLKKGSDFASMMGVSDVITHVGFLPEPPCCTQYCEVVAALKVAAEHCKKNGQYFLFETGQETPVTLRRTIEDVGTDNLGINLDPANLIMYGKANPVDALDVFGRYVRGVHAKDGEYPTDGKNLGQEKPLGQGKVNFPKLIAKLKSLGYDGALSIEREISGDQQRRDIEMAKELLENLIK